MKRRWRTTFLILGIFVLFAGGTLDFEPQSLSLSSSPPVLLENRRKDQVVDPIQSMIQEIQFQIENNDTFTSTDALNTLQDLVTLISQGHFDPINPTDYCNDLSILAIQISVSQSGPILSAICNSTLLAGNVSITSYQAKVLMTQIRFGRGQSQLLFSNISAIAFALLRNDSIDSIGVETANLSIVTQRWMTPRSVSGNTKNGSFFSVPNETVTFVTDKEFVVLFSSLSYNPMVPIPGALTRNIVGNVVGLKLTDTDGNELPVRNVPSNITIEIPVENYTLKEGEFYVCMWWNCTGQFWRTEGCSVRSVEKKSSNASIVRCFCNHLTNFTVAAAYTSVRTARKVGLETIIGPVVGGAAVLIIVVIVAIVAVRIQRKKKEKEVELEELNGNHGRELETLPANSVIERDSKVMGDSNSNFLAIYDEDHEVFVRKVEKKWSANLLQKEGKILEKLRHPNVIRFFGYWKDNNMQLYMILENASLGNLNEFLLVEPDLSRAQRLQISLDISSGMSYLEKMCVVHRDLRIENVFVVKITGGFGIKVGNVSLNSSQSENDDHSEKPKFKTIEEMYRARWMAPEVIKSKQFSSKSDVFSFGVVLWEIFSNGKIPYGPKEESERIFDEIYNGKLKLQFPGGIPSVCEEISEECWDDRESKRPTFAAILSSLSLALDEESGSEYRNSIRSSSKSAATEDSRRLSTYVE